MFSFVPGKNGHIDLQSNLFHITKKGQLCIRLEGPEDPHFRNSRFLWSRDLAHASIPLTQTPWGLTGRAWLQARAQRVVIVVLHQLNSSGIDSRNGSEVPFSIEVVVGGVVGGGVGVGGGGGGGGWWWWGGGGDGGGGEVGGGVGIFLCGQPPQDNSVGSGVVWVTGLFSLCNNTRGRVWGLLNQLYIL